jgi:hypothetical protein
LARFRVEDRRALFLVDDPRPAALFRAEGRAPFLADFLPPFLADLLADFLELLRDAFLADRRVADFLVAFFAALRRGCAARSRRPAGSPKSSYEEGVEAGVGAGVFSIGSGSIQPEPDQPISI